MEPEVHTSLRFYSVIIGAVCLLGAAIAGAQDFPSKPIRVIVPSTPGGSVDIMARIMSQGMSKVLGQPFIVDNKAGGNTVVGVQFAARQAPDGYTILFVLVPELASLPVIIKDLQFDPLKDVPPFIGLAEGRSALASSSKFPWKTFSEFVTYTKVNPGKVNFGYQGPLVHLQTEAIIRGIGIDVARIPYATAATYMQATVSGEIHAGFASQTSVVGYGEKVRVLAVTGNSRSPSFPDVPSFGELGYSQIPGVSYSANAPAGTPKVVLEKLFRSALQVLQEPDVKARFVKFQWDALNETPEAAAKRLADLGKFYADLANKAGIQPQ